MQIKLEYYFYLILQYWDIKKIKIQEWWTRENTGILMYCAWEYKLAHPLCKAIGQ